MLKNERYQHILNYLNEKKSVKVVYLSSLLDVTQETIRRDLEHLEQLGEIERVHGGAILKHTIIEETNFTIREAVNIEEKKLIASHAVQFVKEGNFVALDVSTTNTEIAKELVQSFHSLSIITNSIIIATILCENPNFNVYLPSGKIRNSELCIVGGSCVSYIEKFNIDTFFMSVSGISLEKGLTDYGDGEYEVKMAMYRNARKVFVVADHTKFDSVAMLKIGDLKSVDGIITDSNISQPVLEKYEKHDIHVFV
ncbi:DeoR/GlpR family DNA-binding transcription regulator [Psychrobacillus soli]|uniref:DeoR/GlpR transcriptional regulator n=1 Tax=Psychrobacillus soli TaxID=1543965 RepID=A0A544TFN9_9BACI|nr:DeoR/GlpR family DNA-binding transcription regulator [Psychrobacillus soli]TQR16274.1 DeoR/GlpR transcriptional regulator [Psychrobacillus soli]